MLDQTEVRITEDDLQLILDQDIKKMSSAYGLEPIGNDGQDAAADKCAKYIVEAYRRLEAEDGNFFRKLLDCLQLALFDIGDDDKSYSVFSAGLQSFIDPNLDVEDAA